MKLDCYCQPHIDQKSNWNSVALCILKCLNSQPHLKARTADYRATCTKCGEDYLPASGSICCICSVGRLRGQLTSIDKRWVQWECLLVGSSADHYKCGWAHTVRQTHRKTIGVTDKCTQRRVHQQPCSCKYLKVPTEGCCRMLKCAKSFFSFSAALFCQFHVLLSYRTTQTPHNHTQSNNKTNIKRSPFFVLDKYTYANTNI